MGRSVSFSGVDSLRNSWRKKWYTLKKYVRKMCPEVN